MGQLKKIGFLVMALANIVNWFVPMALAIDPNCDYYQFIPVGRYFYIYNVEYPNNYRGSVSCRWRAESPANSKIVLTCDDISLPASTNCVRDRLAVSITGDDYLTDAHNYCGYGTLSLVSNQNRLSVGLFAPWDTQGGRFSCSITAVDTSNGGNTEQPPTNCECGKRSQRRIVGGVDAAENEFPSMVAVLNTNGNVPLCGGTLMNNRYVLTAAHCLYNRNAASTQIVVSQYYTETDHSGSKAQRYAVQTIIIHPGFNPQTLLNDIGILKTTKTITFGAYVSPICLPFRYSEFAFAGFDVIALGWGTTEFTGPRPTVLQKVNLTVISNDRCATELGDGTVVSSSNLCTYTPYKDACQFDSGGPLFWLNPSNNRLYITGIISNGIGCGTLNPSINTRVTSYLDWIIRQTSDAFYCMK